MRYALLSILTFLSSLTVWAGGGSYWTADGRERPLRPSGKTFQIPADALAVLLNASSADGAVFDVDASQTNANCLFYLNGIDYVPQGLVDRRLVIRDYAISDFVVDSRYDYYCPMPFRAETALFTYTPISERWGEPKPYMSWTMSGTLVLPFDAQQVLLTDVNEDMDLNGRPNAIFRYQGEKDNLLNFSMVTERPLKAYEPYLLRVVPSRVTFYAENTTIPATRQAMAVGTVFGFVGSTVAQTTTDGYYLWSDDRQLFYRSETPESVRPFTAMMAGLDIIFESDKATDKGEGAYGCLYVDGFSGENTLAVEVPTRDDDRRPTEVYTLGGQRVCCHSLKPGLYIIGGRKVMMK